ncbi:MAG TPA: response regulator [Gemmatimonas sp.]|nr:response regulator [Gemmatimonas sp.]
MTISPASNGNTGSVAAGDAPLVLVAEDNEDNRIIAATMLRHSGYRVVEATTGAEAMRIARTERPALILMDVGMPDIDGWSATRTLKDDPDTRHIVILAFTAHALPGDRDHAREAGCDGYLAKPVEPLRLVREVGRALAEAAAGSKSS